MTWLDEIDLSLHGDADGRRRRSNRPHRPLHRSSRSAGSIRRHITVGRLRRTAWGIFVLSLGVFLLRGVDRVRRPVLVPDNTPAASVRVPGFDEIAFEVSGGGPTSAGVTRHCALLASTTPQRDQGLMFRHDLAGYDGVIFKWTAPTTEQFWMKNTLLALSIAWFDQSGRFISSADMAPCPKDANCPLYGAAGPYTTAIEVMKGHLAGLGIGPSSSIAMGGSCS